MEATGKKCEALEGLVEEGNAVVEETETGSMTQDSGIIIVAQKPKHYEIAIYDKLAKEMYKLQAPVNKEKK